MEDPIRIIWGHSRLTSFLKNRTKSFVFSKILSFTQILQMPFGVIGRNYKERKVYSMPPSYTKSKGSRRGQPLYTPDADKMLFNVDTFWYTVDVENYDAVMDDWLRERLNAGRNALEDGEDLEFIEIVLEDYENPLLFEIGKGQKPVYAYQIRNNDFAFYFTKRKRDDKTYPIKVQINQFVLWDKKVIGAFLESQMILMNLGFVLGNAKGNRIDLCCHSDQFQWNAEDLKSSVFSFPRNIAKDNFPNWYKLNPDTGEFETVEFGDRKRCATRIYNKSLEIEKKRKSYFKDIYAQKGMNPEKVWNIEFELHRDLLKEFIHPTEGTPGYFDDINNLLSVEGLSYLWTWLTKYQFTHLSKFWSILQNGDPEQFIVTGDYVIRAKDIDSTVYREFKQIRGRLKKFIITQEVEHGSMMNEAISRFYAMYQEVEEEEKLDYEEEVNKARQKYHDKKINGLLSFDQKGQVKLNRENRQKKEALDKASHEQL